MVMSPAFASNACVVFAAGPIGAALAVFRSNCGERGRKKKKVSRRRRVARLSFPPEASESLPRLAQRPRGRRVLLQLRVGTNKKRVW
jgi:hypothetical protein